MYDLVPRADDALGTMKAASGRMYDLWPREDAILRQLGSEVRPRAEGMYDVVQLSCRQANGGGPTATHQPTASQGEIR